MFADFPPKEARYSGFLGMFMQFNLWHFLFEIYLVALWVIFIAFKGLIYMSEALWKWRINAARSLLGQKILDKKRLIIIGGGYAGTYAATHLEHLFETVLIDTKTYFEFTPSKLRSLVEPEKCQQVQKDFHTILHQTKIVCSSVSQVTTESVLTSVGEVYSYDYLLISSGSRYHQPLFPPFPHSLLPTGPSHSTVFASVRSPSFAHYHAPLRTAHRVVIIGGGTVGVELAAEIVEKFPGRKVALVHSQTSLMHRSPPSAVRHAEQFFIRKGVQLLLGHRVVAHQGCFFLTDKGTVLEADLAFVCTGNIPNSEFMRDAFGDKLTENGFVQVNEFQQLHGYRNIFVAGDISHIPQQEEKLCQTAGAEVSVVIKNLECLLSNAPLHKYVASKCPMLISLGKYDALLTYRGFSLSGFVPAVMKEFVEWKEMIWYWDWHRFFPPKPQYPTCSTSSV